MVPAELAANPPAGEVISDGGGIRKYRFALPGMGKRAGGGMEGEGRRRRKEEMTEEISDKKLFIPAPVPAPLLAAARDLRKNMTDAEQLLWYCLRRKQLDGFRFRRQHPFDRYVLDFYCCEARLAVELDGGQHNRSDVQVRDEERTSFLNTHGIRVVRFWNNEIFTNLEGVLLTIYDALRQASHPGSASLGEGMRSPPP